MADRIHLAHFSDVHITAPRLGWRFRDFFTKRATGWMNVKIGRGRHFRDAQQIAAIMMRDIRERGCQHVVFSGDATAMGFEPEFQAAALSLKPDALPGLAVPGNHDYYTRSAVQSGSFERYFGPWQVGQRIGEQVYPFAQRVGSCWLIGVNSARSNFLLWDARGQMGREQGQRLRQLLAGLGPGLRILVTHYPLYQADGQLEQRWRRLRDLESLRDIAIEGGISLWLHGHRHGCYVLPPTPPTQPFAVVCAGSATQLNRWSYHEYVIEGGHLKATQRSYLPEAAAFVDAGRFELNLPGPQAVNLAAIPASGNALV